MRIPPKKVLGALVIAFGVALPAVALAEDPMSSESVGQIAKMIRWSGVVTSMLVIGLAWFALRVMHGTIDNLSRRFATWRLALNKTATFIQFVIYVSTGATVIALSFRLDDRVLALVGGTVAVSVGFAIKDLVASFVAGIMILVDRPFQVGDRVSFGGFYGDITAIGLRSVRLQTLSDDTVTIPNNKFLSDVTSCGNYGALEMMVVMDFHVGLDQDVTLAREIVREAGLMSAYVFLDKPVVVLATQVIESSYMSLRLRLKAYVLDYRHEKAFETDVNLGVLAMFREHGICPPAILHRGRGTEDGAQCPLPLGALHRPAEPTTPVSTAPESLL